MGGGFSKVSDNRTAGTEPQKPVGVFPGPVGRETEAGGSARTNAVPLRPKGIRTSSRLFSMTHQYIWTRKVLKVHLCRKMRMHETVCFYSVSPVGGDSIPYFTTYCFIDWLESLGGVSRRRNPEMSQKCGKFKMVNFL